MYQFSVHSLEQLAKRNITKEIALWVIENTNDKLVEYKQKSYEFYKNKAKSLFNPTEDIGAKPIDELNSKIESQLEMFGDLEKEIKIKYAEEKYFVSFHQALDRVAKEKIHIEMIEAIVTCGYTKPEDIAGILSINLAEYTKRRRRLMTRLIRWKNANGPARTNSKLS